MDFPFGSPTNRRTAHPTGVWLSAITGMMPYSALVGTIICFLMVFPSRTSTTFSFLGLLLITRYCDSCLRSTCFARGFANVLRWVVQFSSAGRLLDPFRRSFPLILGRLCRDDTCIYLSGYLYYRSCSIHVRLYGTCCQQRLRSWLVVVHAIGQFRY